MYLPIMNINGPRTLSIAIIITPRLHVFCVNILPSFLFYIGMTCELYVSYVELYVITEVRIMIMCFVLTVKKIEIRI